jgi:hypothetical protein
MSDVTSLRVRHAVTENRARHRREEPVTQMLAVEQALRDNRDAALASVVSEGQKRELGHLCLDPITFLTSV